MTVGAKMQKKAAVAAKAAEKEARRARYREQSVSLQDASVRNSGSILPPKSGVQVQAPRRKMQDLDGDAESGPGSMARMKAFLSLRGFEPAGITSAQALSKPTRTHRDRRILAASVASTRQTVQAPNLATVPSARAKAKAPPTPQVPKLRRLGRAERKAASPRLLRRNRVSGPSVILPLSGIDKLRSDLGLLHNCSSPEDAVYVAIDTEGHGNACEIGISTLDTRDIMGVTPDQRAANWISKVKHQHIVISRGIFSYTNPQVARALFCASQIETAENARTLVLTILRLARQSSFIHTPRKVHLVGQSIAGDVGTLAQGSNVRMDLSNGPNADFSFDSVYDTYSLALAAQSRGTVFRGKRLGELAKRLGVDPIYHQGASVRGTHNAGNDAAYTMMVMLLFAVRWNELTHSVAETTLPMASETLETPRRPGAVLTKKEVKKEEKRKRNILTQEVANQRARERRIAREAKSSVQPGLLGKVRKAVSALLWGWR